MSGISTIMIIEMDASGSTDQITKTQNTTQNFVATGNCSSYGSVHFISSKSTSLPARGQFVRFAAHKELEGQSEKNVSFSFLYSQQSI